MEDLSGKGSMSDPASTAEKGQNGMMIVASIEYGRITKIRAGSHEAQREKKKTSILNSTHLSLFDLKRPDNLTRGSRDGSTQWDDIVASRYAFSLRRGRVYAKSVNRERK